MNRLSDIDWTTWKPGDIAVLLFVIRGGEGLFIRKKRGLGAGKINAPGGRIEAGETPEQAAIRETQEEVCVTPSAPMMRGRLRFQFTDGYALECFVLKADTCEGTPRETDEADPRWISLHALPFEEMWADDRLWLPLMLAGHTFDGRFIFDGETMLDHEIVATDPAKPLFDALRALGVEHEVAEHPPVFTALAAKAQRRADEPGAHVKNLFVRDKNGRMWLVTTLEDRVIDLKHLAEKIGAHHLSFASPDRLRKHLGVEPGSVTPFAVMNDADDAVTLVLDSAIREQGRVHCHPLTNDRTVALDPRDLVKFVESTGHKPAWVDLDERD